MTCNVPTGVLRQHPFGSATLRDEDPSVDLAEHAAPGDRVTVVVTAPLAL